MAEKKKAVGLVALTYDGNEWKVILHERGYNNHEKKMAPESYPGGCQVTTHGGLKEGESFKDGLIREAREELGKRSAFILKQFLGNLQTVFRLETDEKVVVTYGTIVPLEFAERALLNASSGGLRLVSFDEFAKAVDLKEFDKSVGVRDRNVIAMFLDEITAVTNTILHFKHELLPQSHMTTPLINPVEPAPLRQPLVAANP